MNKDCLILILSLCSYSDLIKWKVVSKKWENICNKLAKIKARSNHRIIIQKLNEEFSQDFTWYDTTTTVYNGDDIDTGPGLAFNATPSGKRFTRWLNIERGWTREPHNFRIGRCTLFCNHSWL